MSSIPVQSLTNLGNIANGTTLVGEKVAGTTGKLTVAATGTGTLVLNSSPTLVTPVLGVAAATSINKVTITTPATSATLTIANGKTLTCNNTVSFSGTDSSTVAFGAGGTVLYLGSPLGAASATSINFGQDTLNQYDEGTFVPSFNFSTPGDLSVSYAIQAGTYTRIGNSVRVSGTIRFTPTFTTSTGSALFEGFPFVIGTSSILIDVCFISANAPTYSTGQTQIVGSTLGSTSGMQILGEGTGVAGSALGPSEISSGLQRTLVFSGVYYI